LCIEQLSPANTSIWVGSSDGTVTVLTLNNVSFDKPSSGSIADQSSTESMSNEFNFKKLMKATVNSVKHTLKGQIVHISFLDSTGKRIRFFDQILRNTNIFNSIEIY